MESEEIRARKAFKEKYGVAPKGKTIKYGFTKEGEPTVYKEY